jgi:hypothetical protein
MHSASIKSIQANIKELKRQISFLEGEIAEYEDLEALSTDELEDMLQALVLEEIKMGFHRTHKTPNFYKKLKLQNVLSERFAAPSRAPNPGYYHRRGYGR